MAPPDPDCPLCRADRITHWYHEDDLCWIADCEICATPMVVWKEHGQPEGELRQRMLATLTGVGEKVFAQGVWLDGEMRRIPGHFHTHARPRDGFFGHGHKAPGWEDIRA